MSVLLAGGGIRGGQTYGASDRRGEYPAAPARHAGLRRQDRLPRDGNP